MERVGRMQENARYANATERSCGFAGDDSGFTQTGGDQPTRGGPDSLDRMCEGAFEARLNTLQGGDLYLNYGAPIFDVVTLGRVIPAVSDVVPEVAGLARKRATGADANACSLLARAEK